jgi:hypothetical protein
MDCLTFSRFESCNRHVTEHKKRERHDEPTCQPTSLEGGSSYGQHSLTATNFVAINNEMQ